MFKDPTLKMAVSAGCFNRKDGTVRQLGVKTLGNKENVIINHTLFDMNLMRVGHKRVELPYMYSSFLIRDIVVCNNREVYFLSYVAQKERRGL